MPATTREHSGVVGDETLVSILVDKLEAEFSVRVTARLPCVYKGNCYVSAAAICLKI